MLLHLPVRPGPRPTFLVVRSVWEPLRFFDFESTSSKLVYVFRHNPALSCFHC